jgi:hypothetical protein
MRIAYADPPYIGQAKKHYSKEALHCEVNHNLLLGYLCGEFDSWALSLSSPSLKEILSLPNCPSDVRVGAWVKPFASFKPNVNPGYCWEPVLFWHPKKRDRYIPTVRDFVSKNITLRKGLSGAKPKDFCVWIFDLLGVKKEDSFVDIFPGTGIVSECLKEYLK